MKKRLLFISFLLFNCLFPNSIHAQQIREIKIKGATILTPEINKLISDYQKQGFGLEELKKLTTEITNLYVDKGYTTSGAFLPRQEFIDGLITVQIVEGRLKNIEIQGLKYLKKNYIYSRFKKATEGVYNERELEKALGTLYVDPLIKKVRAELITGDNVTSNLLLLEIEEVPILQANLEINNQASPTIGEGRGIGQVTHNNLLGVLDRASFRYDLTEGLSTYDLEYFIPLNYSGTSFSVAYRAGDIRIVEKPLADADIEAEADTLSVNLNQKIANSLTTESSIGLSLDLSQSRTTVLNQPFSLGDGVQDGRSKLSILRLKGDLIKRSNTDVLSLFSQLSLGLDLFDATINDNAPDASFFSWLTRVQYIKTLDREKNITLIGRFTTQLTPDNLLPFEKFALGGITTVRGYRHNRSIGDNSANGTVALAFKVAEELRITPFLDWGRVWDSDGGFDQSLASAGLGIDWHPAKSIAIGIDFGIPLIEVRDRGDSLSDDGLHFSIKWQN